MFIETAVGLFALGYLTGVAFVMLTVVRPRDRHDLAEHRRRLREAKQSLYTAQARLDAAKQRKHLGTPYIAPLPTDLERVLTDISDNDRWSRKAPGLRSVS